MIHITGVKGIILHPAQLPGRPYRVVETLHLSSEIQNLHALNILVLHLEATQQEVFRAFRWMLAIPALPMYLKFMAKDGEQIIATQGSPGSELYYKIWVRKLKEDKAN